MPNLCMESRATIVDVTSGLALAPAVLEPPALD
jgi:short-subunit dehydrogenase involved in D-alanine esterification of teichoic acids